MRQLEGGYYDASKIQLSRRRIDRTGFFSEVNVETRPVEGSPDQVDILYGVKEKPTGALLFGVGFSNVEKLALSASLSQANVFGTGNYLSLNVNSGSVNKVYSISYLNPYYTVDGVSQGFDLYHRKTNASQLVIGAYSTDTYGGAIKFGYPVSEVSRIDFATNLETVRLDTFDNSPQQYLDFVDQFGSRYTYAALSAGASRDTRDSLIQTNSGTFTRASTEVAGGDLQYYRLGFQHQYYRPLSRTYTLYLNADIGYAEGIGDKPLPFFKNYYAGGPGSVRGYASFSLGPLDQFGTALGGNRRVIGSAEFLFPMPGATQDRSLRLGWFIDAGNVFNNSYELNDLRYSAGLGFFWSSPFGPLRLSFAQPLNPKTTDHIQRLQFTFGTGF
jgi:outer membrane protein insertion porin family